MIMNLIATPGIIYASLHNCGLSEYQLSPAAQGLLLQYIQTGHVEGGRWGVVSQLQQQHTLCL